MSWLDVDPTSAGDTASRAGLEKQLKERDAALALAKADLQTAEKTSEERRLEVVRLGEEAKRSREAEHRMRGEIESLRENANELRIQLKESVEANDQIVRAAKAQELEHEQLVGGLIKEVERVNDLILGK